MAGAIFRIEPSDRRHVRHFTRTRLDQVGQPIGIDDEIRLDGRPRRLDQDVDAPGIAASAFGVPNDPAYDFAGCKRT
jgi:hypothetical protein